jgi:hypothetical protein
VKFPNCSRGTVSARRARMTKSLIYKDLDAWKLAIDLVERCYRTTANFPREELYGLTGQLRRAAVPFPQMSPKDIAGGLPRYTRTT